MIPSKLRLLPHENGSLEKGPYHLGMQHAVSHDYACPRLCKTDMTEVSFELLPRPPGPCKLPKASGMRG
jgi:hypothetical protein